MSARVGIDIGAAGVRVVETSGLNADSHTQITKAAIVPLHPGAVVGGRVVDQVAVAWAVAKAVKDAGVSSHGVIMGLASANTALVRFAVPAALRPDEWALAFRSSGKPLLAGRASGQRRRVDVPDPGRHRPGHRRGRHPDPAGGHGASGGRGRPAGRREGSQGHTDGH